MAKNNNLTDFVRDLADGFREKLGWPSTDKINPQDFRDFIAHSPSVGTLTTGLEPLNWTKLLKTTNIDVECPEMETQYYYDEATQTQMYPLIKFRIQAEEPLTDTEEIRIFDAYSDTTIGTLTQATETVDYIVPVFAALNNRNSAYFSLFAIAPQNIRAGGIHVSLTATWVQIGSTQYPMRLSGATMGGIK